ncbi:MAG TPA: DsbA family oxidoreductase [Pseudogracilibacillus sp.]|nr:DsbA family oxidoreductase [Pseudogracilibacillus sp.]
MKIEVWSDFTCPYCYIGKRRLDLAIEKFGKKNEIEIEYKSFELDFVTGSRTSNQTTESEPYKMNQGQINEIISEGHRLGIPLQLDNLIHTNTFDAHRLVKCASKYNKAHEIVEKLFETHLVRHYNLAERSVLLSIATDAGLDKAEIEELLCLNKYGKNVKLDEEMATDIGVNKVPFYIFDEIHAISGLLTTDSFLDVLQELWHSSKEDKPAKPTSYCTETGCHID